MRRQPFNRLLLAIGLLLATAPAFAEMVAKPVEWKVGKDRFSGYLVYDNASTDKRPGLVMVPNWMGVTKDSIERAKAVAGDDYVVLVADVYGKGKRPKNAKEAGTFAGGLRGDDRTRLRARMQGALDALKAQAAKSPLDADRIGALGFCFGGSAVLELAREGSELAGVVSLHGGLAPGAKSATATEVKTPVLVLNGADDKAVPDADILAFEFEMGLFPAVLDEAKSKGIDIAPKTIPPEVSVLLLVSPPALWVVNTMSSPSGIPNSMM